MIKMKIAAVFAAAAIALSGCGAAGNSVVTVGNNKVSGGDLDFYITELTGRGASFDEYKSKAAADIESQLLMNEVGKSWGFTLTDDEKDSVNSSLIRIRQQMGGKKEFDEKVKKYGTSEEFVKKLIESTIYTKKYQAAVDLPQVTTDQMKEYFKKNFYRAKHVLITTKDMTTGAEKDKNAAKTTAEDILKRAQAGENFDSLIENFGEDPGMATNPDGYVFTTGEMVSQFEEKTDELKPGEIGMCETDYGYHVILRLALDETPELFEKFYSEKSSAVKEAMDKDQYDSQLAIKADEYGIKHEVNDQAVNDLKQKFPEDSTKSDSSK